MKRALSVLLFAAMLLSLTITPAVATETTTATTMRLEETEGSVNVTNASGKAVSRMDGMRLYSGYQICTGKNSYAYLSLDGGKAVKLDASSAVILAKSGRKLELKLSKGKLFFDVSTPLKSDETLNVRTSTMVTGIRGTVGWVEIVSRFESVLNLLEGRVNVLCTDLASGIISNRTIMAGETIQSAPTENPQIPDGTPRQQLHLLPLEEEGVPGFVWEELAEDPELVQRILEDPAYEGQELTPIGLPPLPKEDSEPAPEAMDQLKAQAEETLNREQTASDQREEEIKKAAEQQKVQEAEPAFAPEPEPEQPSGGGGGETPPPAPPEPEPEQPSGGGEGETPPPGPSVEDFVMAPPPQTAQEIQDALAQHDVVVLQNVNVNIPAPNGLVIHSGKTLKFQSGTLTAVPQDAQTMAPNQDEAPMLTGIRVKAGGTLVVTGTVADGIPANPDMPSGSVWVDGGRLELLSDQNGAAAVRGTVYCTAGSVVGNGATFEAETVLYMEGQAGARPKLELTDCRLTAAGENGVGILLSEADAVISGTLTAQGQYTSVIQSSLAGIALNQNANLQLSETRIETTGLGAILELGTDSSVTATDCLIRNTSQVQSYQQPTGVSAETGNRLKLVNTTVESAGVVVSGPADAEIYDCTLTLTAEQPAYGQNVLKLAEYPSDGTIPWSGTLRARSSDPAVFWHMEKLPPSLMNPLPEEGGWYCLNNTIQRAQLTDPTAEQMTAALSGADTHIEAALTRACTWGHLTVPNGKSLTVTGSAGGSASAEGLTVEYGGRIVLNSAKLNLTGSAQSGNLGTIQLNEAGVLDVGASQTFTNESSLVVSGGTLNNQGVLNNRKGSLQITAAGTVVSGGPLVNEGSIENQGTLTVSGGLTNQTELQNTGTLTTGGTSVNTGTLHSSGALINQGTFTNRGTISGNGRNKNDTSAQLVNEGTVSLGNFAGESGQPFENQGTILVKSGEFCMNRYQRPAISNTAAGVVEMTGGQLWARNSKVVEGGTLMGAVHYPYCTEQSGGNSEYVRYDVLPVVKDLTAAETAMQSGKGAAIDLSGTVLVPDQRLVQPVAGKALAYISCEIMEPMSVPEGASLYLKNCSVSGPLTSCGDLTVEGGTVTGGLTVNHANASLACTGTVFTAAETTVPVDIQEARQIVLLDCPIAQTGAAPAVRLKNVKDGSSIAASDGKTVAITSQGGTGILMQGVISTNSDPLLLKNLEINAPGSDAAALLTEVSADQNEFTHVTAQNCRLTGGAQGIRAAGNGNLDFESCEISGVTGAILQCSTDFDGGTVTGTETGIYVNVPPNRCNGIALLRNKPLTITGGISGIYSVSGTVFGRSYGDYQTTIIGGTCGMHLPDAASVEGYGGMDIKLNQLDPAVKPVALRAGDQISGVTLWIPGTKQDAANLQGYFWSKQSAVDVNLMEEVTDGQTTWLKWAIPSA